MLPFILLGCPYVLNAVWLALAIVSTCFSHCGYYSMTLMSGMPHHYHHTFQNVFYGAGGYFDYVLKTRLSDKYPKRWKELVKVDYMIDCAEDWRYL